MPVEVTPAWYDVPSELWNEHDGDIPGLLAALSDSVVDIERDSSGLMATLAMLASSSSGGPSTSRAPGDDASSSRAPRHDGASTSHAPGHDGASSSCAPRHDGASISRAASSATVVHLDDDSDDDSVGQRGVGYAAGGG